VDPEVVAQGRLLASAAANACLDLAGKAGLQDRNTQVAEDRMAYCNQDLVRSCPAEAHSRDHIVVEDNSRRIEVVEDSLVEEMETGHGFEEVDLDLGVVEGQDERHSVDQSSVECLTVHVFLISTAHW
jgi:hypothetical protein